MEIDLDQLISSVEDSTDEVLDRVAAAALLKDRFEQMADDLLDHFVGQARAEGRSWTQIGEALGVTRQAAQQRHGGLLDRLVARLKEGRFRRFTPRARTAVIEAQSAARDRHHGYIGTEHVLLGLLTRNDDAAARLLAGWGVERSDVERDVVARHANAPAGGPERQRRPGRRTGRSARADDDTGERPHVLGHIPFTRPAKKALELALRESMALGNSHIGAEHVLLGLLRADDMAAELLAARGVTYDRVDAALEETTGDGPTDD